MDLQLVVGAKEIHGNTKKGEKMRLMFTRIHIEMSGEKGDTVGTEVEESEKREDGQEGKE